MTIEQLMEQVGAPSVAALEAKLVEFGLTLADCEGSKAYRQDLTNIFASGLAVVDGGAVATTETPKEAPIAPAQKKGKGGRMTKAQKVEMAQAQAEEQAQAATSALDITTAQTIKSAQRQDTALTNLEDDVSAYLTGRYLGVNAAIARNVLGGIKDAGDSCDVGLADITEKAVGSALELFFASVGE